MSGFADRLSAAVLRCQTPVLVGLDPRLASLPQRITRNLDLTTPTGRATAYVRFCQDVIDVVAPLVPAVKPQAAFFEQLGPQGMVALADVIEHAHRAGLLVILDGKRNDIGSTAEAYADGWLRDPASPNPNSPEPAGAWGADALTVSPYLGDDSLEPFVEVARKRDAGVFVLVKTSNAGGGRFQDPLVDGLPLYRHVGQCVEQLAQSTLGECGYGAVGAVVGATYPEQLEELRSALPHTWFLVPGFGSQGGTAADVAAAFDARGLGAIINNSRGIIFAHRREPYAERFGEQQWQQAVEAATRDMINQLRAETPAGQLAT